MANGFTELLDIGLPENALWLVFAMLAAIVSWINKRKEAAKLEQESHTVPTQRSQHPDPDPDKKSTGWLARLEQLTQAQLDQTDRELESHYDDNYELESVETPMIIPVNDLPPVIGTTAQQAPRTREAPKRSVAEQASRKARQPTPSPVYSSPIYTGNIAHRIGTNIKIARQAVVASIILGQPRSLEKPE
ncbi:MAG: hypothetical protein OSB55_04810 [Verrucomicrobiota bacterium]|nr:hypothetical protein [Verrucomicrobiota bacterium]